MGYGLKGYEWDGKSWLGMVIRDGGCGEERRVRGASARS